MTKTPEPPLVNLRTPDNLANESGQSSVHPEQRTKPKTMKCKEEDDVDAKTM